MPLSPPTSCVVLAICPGGSPVPECDERLRELERRGYPVWRVRGSDSLDSLRSRLATDALARGFDELMWVGGDVVFDPADIDRLRAHNLPLCGAAVARTGGLRFDAAFLPGTDAVPFGNLGGLHELHYLGFGFVHARRAAFEAVAAGLALPECDARFGPPMRPYFLPMVVPDGPDPAASSWYLGGDFAFCERARRCGVRIVADTRVRVWRVGSYPYSWEETAAEPRRGGEFSHRALPPDSLSTPPSPVPDAATDPFEAADAFRGPALPLPAGFPRVRAYLMTYAANRESAGATLADFRQSDWGEDPGVFVQPPDWPAGKESASRNYARILEAALADGCDFALILEDDVRVCRRLREALTALPLVARDQCDYLSLFVPDLLASPWQRREPALGYRLAKPLYAGPNRMWEKYRVWGSQAYLLSRRFLLAALERWRRLSEGQDSRVVSVCSELKLPLWYTEPCLVQHAPLRTAFGTPAAYAADFRADYRPSYALEVGGGFQPPEAVPGWLTLDEARLLWEAARGLDVLELGTFSGRSTVCLAQSAARVVSVDARDQSEAAEWLRRYGLSERVELLRGDVAEVVPGLAGRFGLAFVDTGHDAASVARDIALTLGVLEPGGAIAFHDYPDPAWPDVRRAVDEHASRLGWVRVAQADYLGIFRTP